MNNHGDNITERDLFEREEKGKEILDNGQRVVMKFKTKWKYSIEVTKNSIKLTCKGLSSPLNGTRTFNINQILTAEYKEPKTLSDGCIKFVLVGNGENLRNLWASSYDPNAIIFTKKEDRLMRELKAFVDYQIEKSPQQESSNSNLNDLEMLKQLTDRGILTQDEFTAKKKQILGL